MIIASVMAPVESASLPGPLERLAPDAPVAAQAPPPPPALPEIVTVPGDPCPAIPQPRPLPDLQLMPDPAYATNPDDAPECLRQTAACPVNPVVTTTFLAPSVGLPYIVDTAGVEIPRYPGFCEVRFDEMAEPASYTACTTTTGFIRMIHEIQPAEHMCRLLHPSGCVVGLHRTGSNQCRVVKRRTWTCPADYIPRNEFGTCYYTDQLSHTGPHPACGSGAPDFVAQSCEDYVGNDYTRSSTLVSCAADFDTGSTTSAMSANSLSGSAAVYWCEFDPDFLKVECHATPPPAADCNLPVARCLKRASLTGGCNAIARTISCRALQSALITAATPPTVEQVRDEGCEPCVVLPFRAAPSDCPGDVTDEPDPVDPSWQLASEMLHSSRMSLSVGHRDCRPLGEAVRSGRVIDYSVPLGDPSIDPDLARCLRQRVCDGAPSGRLTWKSAHHADLAIVNSPVILRISDLTTDSQVVTYSYFDYTFTRHFSGGSRPIRSFGDETFRGPFDDPVWRFWPRLDPGNSYGDVVSWFGAAGTGTCVLSAESYSEPEFRVRVEELRPDDPAERAEIESLFGSQSLAWWDRLSAVERQRHTRTAPLNEEVACNVGTTVWCRWVPTRPGYFKVTGAGSWLTRQFGGPRSWYDTYNLNSIVDFLRNQPGYLGVQAAQVAFTAAGVANSDFGMTGLPATMPTMLNRPPAALDDEWLYTTAAGDQHRCPTLDARVECGVTTSSGAYGETEPVGIVVYEMRVATRLPNI